MEQSMGALKSTEKERESTVTTACILIILIQADCSVDIKTLNNGLRVFQQTKFIHMYAYTGKHFLGGKGHMSPSCRCYLHVYLSGRVIIALRAIVFYQT